MGREFSIAFLYYLSNDRGISSNGFSFISYNSKDVGHLGDSVVECLPLTQVMISGSWDRVLNRAPHGDPAYVFASLSVSLMNK